jgi:hypothetical protein
MLDPPRTYHLLAPAIFSANQAHTITPVQRDLLVQHHRSQQAGCEFLIERLIVLFITGFVLSLSLLFFGYEASHLPQIISQRTIDPFWFGALVLVGMNLFIGYLGIASGVAIGGAVRGAIARWRRNRAFWRELNAGATITVEGTILAVRGGPLGFVPGRATPLRVLPFEHMTPWELRPGRYHICYLPATDILLSATPSESPSGDQIEIASGLGVVSALEVQANHSGQLSPSQGTWLRCRLGRAMWRRVAVLVAVALIAGVLLTLLASRQVMSAEPTRLPIVAVVAALIEGFIVANLLWLGRWRGMLWSLPIRQAEGPILRGGPPYVAGDLFVGEFWMEVAANLDPHLREGWVYRVYYLRLGESRRAFALSAELLRAATQAEVAQVSAHEQHLYPPAQSD